ncbi:MAG: replication factor C large subunit [Candidatus Aenigmatarchaeota archaeon]
MLTEKYKPKSLDEVVGQNQVIIKLEHWFSHWKRGEKCLFLCGPPGIGKTCVIEAFAAEKNLELIEMNASDYRTAEQISKVAGNASAMASLTNRKKLILIDEVDNLDRHETVTPLVNLIKNSGFPIVLTSNDAWNIKIRPLHAVSEIIHMRRVMSFSVTKKLKEISAAEKLNSTDDHIKAIAAQCAGDLRSAINDLESFSSETYRERRSSIFDAVRTILKTNSAKDAKTAISLLSEDPEYVFWWVENNVIEEYKNPNDLANAMKTLALADLFRTRIKNQNWKMLGYFIDLFTSGTALAKKETYGGFTMYRPPDIISSLGSTKKSRALRKELCRKIGKKLNESPSTVNTEYLPFLAMLKRNDEIAKYFNLTDEEIEILKA